MGTIITAATIMAMYINSSSNLNSQYCYNAEMENGRIKTMYVYDKVGESLSGKLEYRYEYDNQGRVTVKETYRRNARTCRMTPESRLTFTYTADGYTLERSLWNGMTKTFDRADSRTDYRKETSGIMSVTAYSLDKDGSTNSVTDNFLIIMTKDEGLMADF